MPRRLSAQFFGNPAGNPAQLRVVVVEHCRDNVRYHFDMHLPLFFGALSRFQDVSAVSGSR